MHGMQSRSHIAIILACALSSSVARDKAWAEDRAPKALAEGRKGVVVGVTGRRAVQVGLETLKEGGSAADAAIATALAQVVECGGCYVSFAGVLSMVYYEADSGKVHCLNAGFKTPRDEKEPLTIPGDGRPSGRTALVPGFMAGVQTAHDRFGKLSRKEVFAPAIEMAERGVKVSALLADSLRGRKNVLTRRQESREIFMKADETLYTEGDEFRQPQAAQTLRRVASEGSAFMYTGAWAEKFVRAAQAEGGKLTLDDMKSYQATWEDPLTTTYRGYDVCVLSSQGGVTTIEALHLLEQAELPRLGRVATTPASLFRLMQISHCQSLGFLPEKDLQNFDGLDLTPTSRLKRETAACIWQRMQNGTWPFSATLRPRGKTPQDHSDAVVAVDRWGNMAAVTHSIYTSAWGHTGLFVDGVSIPDSASLLQAAMQEVGPGKRLPNAMRPLIVLKDGKPFLGSSTIGKSLHQKTLQVLTNVLDFGMDAQAAAEEPSFLMADLTVEPPVAQVERGVFDKEVLDKTRALGQEIRELPERRAANEDGYWVGVHIASESDLRRAIGKRNGPLPDAAAAY